MADSATLHLARWEEWRPIPSAPTYEASSLGRVRSLDSEVSVSANKTPEKKRTSHLRKRKGRILRPGLGRYANVNVAGRVGLVHRLVLEAFVGPCPPGHIVRHGPGGPLDNRPCNLSYGTPADNNGTDRQRDGTLPRGERSGTAKLSSSDVRAIRRLAALGAKRCDIAEQFNVSAAHVGRIVAGKIWAWLDQEVA